jgi:hypothetical protein
MLARTRKAADGLQALSFWLFAALLLLGCNNRPEDEIVCYHKDSVTHRYRLKVERQKDVKWYFILGSMVQVNPGEMCIATLFDVGKKFDDPSTHFFFPTNIKAPAAGDWSRSFSQSIAGKMYRVQMAVFLWEDKKP